MRSEKYALRFRSAEARLQVISDLEKKVVDMAKAKVEKAAAKKKQAKKGTTPEEEQKISKRQQKKKAKKEKKEKKTEA